MSTAGPTLSASGARTYVARLAVNPDFTRAFQATDHSERKVLAVELRRQASTQVMKTLAPKLDALLDQGVLESYEPLPLVGQVIIKSNARSAVAAWHSIRSVGELGRVWRSRPFSLRPIFRDEGGSIASTVRPYHIDRVKARCIWDAGYKGRGVTVGLVDSGVDVQHVSLKSRYRGVRSDGTFDHAYNFFDAVNGKREAYDDNGHGTHVAGIVAGGTDTLAIGIAPEAHYIATKVMDRNNESEPATILRGLEWMLAPRDASRPW